MPVLERTESYSKEIDDVGCLLVELVAKIKVGTPIAELVAGVFPCFVKAVENVSEIPGEVSGNQQVAIRTISARMGELVGVLLAPAPAKAELPVAPPEAVKPE